MSSGDFHHAAAGSKEGLTVGGGIVSIVFSREANGGEKGSKEIIPIGLGIPYLTRKTVWPDNGDTRKYLPASFIPEDKEILHEQSTPYNFLPNTSDYLRDLVHDSSLELLRPDLDTSTLDCSILVIYTPNILVIIIMIIIIVFFFSH